MAGFSDYNTSIYDTMSWSDIEQYSPRPASAAQRRFLDMTKTFDEKLKAVEDNRFEKLANINDYNIDVTPSKILDPDTLRASIGGQEQRIRLSSGTALGLDAIDDPNTLFGRNPNATKAPNAIRKQLFQVAEMVGKPVWELTDDDINQVRNWQSTDFFRRLIDPNFKFQKFDPNQRYEDATGAIENLTLKGKILGKDDRGRLIMDILNPYTKSSLGFDLATNPYTNAYFNEAFVANTKANKNVQENYELAHKSTLSVLEDIQRKFDTDSRLGESLDLAKSGIYQFGARWLKSIPGFDNKYWEKVASSDTGKRWADWFAGVNPKTREEYAASGARIQRLVEEGKFDEAAVEAASNLDRFVAESAVQMGLLAAGMWATGGLASLGVAGRLAHLGLGAVPVALDKVFQDAIDFKKNNGREMTKGEYARTFAGALISTVPDELLFGMFSKTTGGLLSKFVKRGLQTTGTKIAKDSSDIALKALGKPLVAAATEGGQEMFESGWDAASSAKQDGDFWTEILPREMTSTENQTAGLVGFMMGGALGSAGSALDFSIENKLNSANTKQQQKFEQNRTVNTPAGTPANTQISKEALGRMSKIDVQPGQSIETSKAALDALNKEDNYLLNGKAYEEKYKKTAQANLNIATEMYKKGASDEEIQKETGKTRQEAFSDFAQTYGSGYNSQYAYEHNTKYTKAENATMEKELLAIAKGLGLTTEEAKKTLKEVKEDIRRGPYGYETYGKQIQKGYDILRNNPDMSDDEKLDVQNTIKGYAHKLLNLYGYQTAKLAAFAEQYDLIDEGKKATAEVKYPNRRGSFKLEGYWLSSQTFDSKKGAHGVVQDIYDSIKEMQNILDNVDIMSNEDRDAFLKSYNESSTPFKVDATEADVLYNRIRSAADRIVERGSAELAPVSQITSRDSANTIGHLQNMLKLEDDDKEGTKEYTNYRRWFFKVLREQPEAYDKINEFIDTNKTLSDERKTQLKEKLADLKDALSKSEARRTQDDVDRTTVITRAKTAINTVTADFLKPYTYRKGKDTPEEWSNKHNYLTGIINALNNTKQPDGSVKQGLITQLSRLATNSVEDRKLLADLKNLVTKVTDLRRENEMAYKKNHGKKKASRVKNTKGTTVVDNKITIEPAEAEKIKNSSPDALIRTLNALSRDMDDNKSEQDALKKEDKVDASLKEEMTKLYLRYKLAHETLASKNKEESYDPNVLSKYDDYRLKDDEVVSPQTTSTTTNSTATETSNKPASKQPIKGEISEAYKKIFDKMYKDKDIEGLKDYERQYDKNIKEYKPGTQEYANAYTTRSYITKYINELTKPQKATNFKEKVTNLINNEWAKIYNTQKYGNTEVIDLHNDKTHGKQNKWLDEAKTTYYVYGGRNGTNEEDIYIGNQFELANGANDEAREKAIRACWNTPAWVDNVEKLISELKQLKKENSSLKKIELGCWCAPKPCHLNLVARLVQDEVFGQSQTSAQPSATDAVSEAVKAPQSEAEGKDDKSQGQTSETSPTASQEASEESQAKTSKPILFSSKSKDYNFLSNFYPVEINYKGHKYPSVEHAFQAAKTDNENEKKQFYVKEEGGAGLTALEAKRAGKKVTLRKDWENVKLDILNTLLSLKFFPAVNKNKASELFEKLNSNLLYEATGYDEFYGVNPKTLEGTNALGELLMRKAEAIYGKPIPEEYGPLRSGTEFDENMIKKTLGSDRAKELIADIRAGKGKIINKVTGESYNDIFNAKIQVLGQVIRKAKTPSSISEETLTLLKDAVSLARNLNKNVYNGSEILNGAINGIVRYISRIPEVSESDFKVSQPDASNTPENALRIDQNAQDGKTSTETQEVPQKGAEGPKSGSQEQGYQPSEEDREIMEELGLDESIFTTEPKIGDFKIKTASDLRAAKSVYRHAQDAKYEENFDDLDAEANLTPIIDDSIDDSAPIDTTIVDDNVPIDESPVPSKSSNSTRSSRPSSIASSSTIKGQTITKPVDTLFDEIARSDNLSNALSKNEPNLFTKKNDNNTTINLTLKEYINGLAKEQVTRIKNAMQQRVDTLNKLSQNELNDLALVPYAKSLDIFFHGLANEVSPETRSTLFNIVQTSVANELSKLNKNVKIPYSSIIYSLGDTYTKKSISDTMMNKETSTLSTTNALFNDNNTNRHDSNTLDSTHKLLSSDEAREPYHLTRQFERVAPKSYVGYDYKSYYPRMRKRAGIFDKIKFSLTDVKAPNGTVIENPYAYFTNEIESELEELVEVVKEDGTVVQERRKTGEKVKRSMLDNTPHYRLIYDIYADPENKTIEFENNEYTMAMMDFTLVQAAGSGQLESMMVKHKASGEEAARMFGRDPEDCTPEQLAALANLVNKQGTSMQRVASYLGRQCLQNMGLVRSGNGFDKEYDRIAVGLGMHMLTYGSELGLFKLNQYKLRVSKNGAKVAVEGVPSALLTLFNADSLTLLKPLGKNNKVLDDLKLEWEGHIDTNGQLIGDGLNKFERERSEVTKQFYGKPPKHRLSETLYVKNTKRTNTVGMTQKEFVFKNRDNMEWKLDMEMARDIVANANAFRRFSGYKFDSTGTKSITEVEAEAKLLTMNARTKYEGINSAIDRQIEALETCIKELDEIAANGGTDKDQAIYFENFVSRNARYFIDSTEMNPQTNKIQRFCCTPKNSWHKQNLINPTAQEQAEEYFSLAQAFDRVKATDEQIEEEGKILTALDVSKTEALLKAFHEAKSVDDFTDRAKEITGLELGMETPAQAYSAIRHLVRRAKCFDENGKPKVSSFDTNLMVENDATTSGYAVRFANMPSPNLMTEERNYLEKVGLFHFDNEEQFQQWLKDHGAEGDEHAITMHVIKAQKGFQDIYRTAASDLSVDINELNETNAKKLIKDKISKAVKYGYEKHGKKTIIDDSPEMDAAVQSMYDVFEKLKPALPTAEKTDEVDKNGNPIYKIDSYLRELMKDPTMVFGYSAGAKSISRKVAANLLDEYSDYFMMVKNEYGNIKGYIDSHAATKEQALKENKIYDKNYKKVIASWDAFTELEKKSGLNLTVAMQRKFFADIWFKQGERKVNLARYFEDMVGATYGDAIGEILEAQYKEFVHINNMAIWVTTSMYQMYVDRRAKGIKKLLEKYSNGKIPLSEINALTKELEDAYPYVKLASNQIGENNQPDSRLDLIKDRRQIDSTTQVQNYVVNVNGQLENNMTGYGEAIVPAPPGRSGAVLLTHGFDSHEIMYTGKVVPLVPINMVHDALVMSAYQQLYSTRGYNESTLVLGDAYSIFGQIVENFERCCEAELQARYKEENALNNPQEQQRIKEAFYSETLKNDRGETIKAGEYNRRAHPSESNLLDSKEPMTRQYLSERIHIWNGIINNWREAFYGNGSVVYCCNCDGVRGTGFAYRRTQNDQVARAEEAFKKFEGQDYYKTSGSTYAGFKTDGELKVLHQQAISDPKARVEILHSLNDLAKDTDELVVSDKFMKELEDLIANANPHALKDSIYELIENGRFTAGEATIQNTGEARIRVFMDDKQHTDMITKRAIESQMAPAEIFAHEIEHAVLHPAFTMTDALGFRPQMQELNGYYEIARELTKPEDFMIEGDYDPNLRDLYKKHAQHSYDYFFNNSDIAGNRGLFEWAALIRTSEKFRNLLTQRFAEKHGEKPATKFIDKLINLIKSITDVLFRRKSLVEAFPKIFGSTTARAKAQGLQFLDEIDNIIDTMARANNKAIKKLETHPAKSKENFFKFLGMWVLNHNRPLGQWLKKHTIDLAKTMGWDKKAASQKLPLNGSFFDTAKLYASTTLMYPISPEHRKMWRELLTRVFKVSQQGILFSLARDMSKPDFNSSLLEFQALRSKDADTVSKQIEHLTRLNLEGGFDRKLNTEERVSLTHAYLYTDAQCLLPYGFSYIKKAMLDDTFVNNEIQKRINYIKKHFKNDRDYYWIVSQCVGTARFMITGQGNEQLNTNAYGIAIGNFYDNKIEFTEENYKNINELITLYAIQNTDADQKLLASSLNQAGLENFLNTHRDFVDESINGVKTDDMDMSKTTKIIEPIHVMKGYTKQLIDTTYETQIALIDPESQKMMRNQGFKLVQKIYPNDVTKHEYVLGIYKRYGIPKRRDGAAFNLIGYHAMGSTLESMSYKDVLTLSTDEDVYDSAALAEKRIQLSEMYKRNADVKSAKLRERMTRGPMTFEDFDKLSYGFSPIASPLGSGKAIADYRITMSLDNKRKIFGLEEDGIETLSKMFASMNKKAKASAANKALVEFLIEDMNKNMNPNTHLGKHGKAYNYIKLSEFTDNKYLQEAWRVLPKELKEAMQKQEIWVREDWLQNLFGVANMSLNDTWLVKKIPSYYLKRLIGIAEMILKTIAYYRKQSIVLKIPGVLIGNIVSNFMFSVVNHANPLKVLKLTILNAKAIREYLNTKKQLNTIILKQRLGTATNAEIASKNMLRTRLQNNMVHPLMEMGMYQSIVEDLNPEELESTSKLTKMLKHNKLVEKIPPSLKNIAKHLYIAEGTPLYDFMFTATQYSDFIARATEYQLTMEKQDKVYKNLMKSKPTPENERYFKGKEGYERFKKDYRTITLMRVLNAFINYDKPQSKGEQYLNDIGALMFSKFAKRIQHVIAEQLWENPLGALAFLLSQHFLVDTEDIFEQNVFNKNWSALFNTPWDNFQGAVVPMPLQILFGDQKFMG